MIFPDGHSDPRTWHTPSPLETRRCVERRASLSHRARLSLANETSASRGTHGPTDCGGDQHGTRSTHPAARTGGRVVISRTETSAEPARAASDRRPTPHSSRAPRGTTDFTMADWWNSIQKGAQEAAETTKFVSMRTKLQAEVMYIENQIKTCLQKFGVEVFPHMENNNSAQVQQHFTDTKREVENYREQIAAKNVEIAELNKQIENIGKAEGK